MEYGYIESICHDMIHHLVNDIVVMRAKPLAVLDTIVSSDLSKIRVLPIFRLIKTIGSITEEEMLRTFNCGVGFNLVVSPDKKDDVIRHVQKWYPCYEIGTIEKGDTRSAFRGRISWN